MMASEPDSHACNSNAASNVNCLVSAHLVQLSYTRIQYSTKSLCTCYIWYIRYVHQAICRMVFKRNNYATCPSTEQ